MRERDRRRLRELAVVLALVVPLGLGLLAFTWLHLQVLETGYRVDRLEKALHEKSRRQKQLELEATYLSSPHRVEARASEELGMVPSSVDQVLFWGELR
ncbi:MAG: hypothetical protein AAF604_02770 [Acidobacteriota bacterium]